MRRTLSALGVAIAALVTTAGCTNVSVGTPAAAPPTGLKLNGAPHVADPVDTAKFQDDPCSTVSATQLTALNIGTQTNVTFAVLGPSCQWGADLDLDPSAFRAILTYRTSESGLSGIYAQRHSYQVFTVLPPIEGYPAVLAEQTDQRPYGGCVITVGVADGVAIDVGLTVTSGQYATDPCTPDTQLATDVVTNLKTGGT
ncbi:MAG TPA: DUF3558 domain-containing protein [Pseudonocardiaceae bacterium]|nr:DUF3558 domain-containing protein [Pseudonocardiaceae bacterium]